MEGNTEPRNKFMCWWCTAGVCKKKKGQEQQQQKRWNKSLCGEFFSGNWVSTQNATQLKKDKILKHESWN